MSTFRYGGLKKPERGREGSLDASGNLYKVFIALRSQRNGVLVVNIDLGKVSPVAPNFVPVLI